jgi:hypothetical protein
MRISRRFQPVLDGLSYRIAPSSLLASPAAALLMSHSIFSAHAVTASGAQSLSHANAPSHQGVTMSADDTDMSDGGTIDTILAGPPPSNGNGTLTG